MRNIILLLAAGLLICNCASVSTLQTARVLDKDDSFHTLGFGFYSSDDFLGGTAISTPVLEYTYRKGWTEKLDWGVKVAIIGTISADVKYNLISKDKFALATGLGLGYLSFTSKLGAAESKSTILDFMIPLYLSYDTSKMLSFYGAGKYIYRSISADTNVTGGGSMASVTGGIKYGDTSGVFVEGSLMAGLEHTFQATQFNTAYFFKF